jgi:hypothetical protein
MAPIWAGDFEISEIAALKNIVCVEFHSKTTSNNYRSNVQIVLPSPTHKIGIDDEVAPTPLHL